MDDFDFEEFSNNLNDFTSRIYQLTSTKETVSLKTDSNLIGSKSIRTDVDYIINESRKALLQSKCQQNLNVPNLADRSNYGSTNSYSVDPFLFGNAANRLSSRFPNHYSPSPSSNFNPISSSLMMDHPMTNQNALYSIGKEPIDNKIIDARTPVSEEVQEEATKNTLKYSQKLIGRMTDELETVKEENRKLRDTVNDCNDEISKLQENLELAMQMNKEMRKQLKEYDIASTKKILQSANDFFLIACERNEGKTVNEMKREILIEPVVDNITREQEENDVEEN